MSIPVGLDELPERIAERRSGAFLVTVGSDGAAHVASVRPEWQDGRVAVPAGRISRANAAGNPRVTLLWPGPDGDFALLVDGDAAEEAEGLSVRPVHAVLHRQA